MFDIIKREVKNGNTDYWLKNGTFNELLKEAVVVRITKDGFLELCFVNGIIGVSLASKVVLNTQNGSLEQSYAKLAYLGDYKAQDDIPDRKKRCKIL